MPSPQPSSSPRLARFAKGPFARAAWGLCAVGAAVLLAACSMPMRQNTATPQPQPARLSSADAQSVTVYAIGLVGTPYRWGGNTPDSGFDCSGLIAHVYQKGARISSPRTVAELKNWGTPLATGDLRSGDVVVFSKGSEATHAGIYVGDGRFVHAPSTGGRVRLDRLQSSYWANYQVAYIRP